MKSIFLVLFLFTVPGRAQISDATIQLQYQRAKKYMLSNVSPQGTTPGAVIASPSKFEPNYYYHWTRDAALVMQVIFDLSTQTHLASEAEHYIQLIKDYVYFSRLTQTTASPFDPVGEPKFQVDGTAYLEPWGRPQNDGPALRALMLTRFANFLLSFDSSSESGFVTNWLYNSSLPTNTVIKTDLEYTAHNWQNPSFDVWEEVKGLHFYHFLVQHQALAEGSQLAAKLNDPGASHFYLQQAHAIEKQMGRFFDANKNYFVATLDQTDGLDYKNSNLDSVSILAILHSSGENSLVAPSDPRTLLTLAKLNQAFHTLFPINQNSQLGTALGRYPEDRYNGTSTSSEGHAWFLTTLASAEMFYRIGLSFIKETKIDLTNETKLYFFDQILKINIPQEQYVIKNTDPTFKRVLSALLKQGDDQLKRVFTHMEQQDGRMSEQFDRHTGYMRGAHDLTWSYASFITAIHARNQLINSLSFTAPQ